MEFNPRVSVDYVLLLPDTDTQVRRDSAATKKPPDGKRLTKTGHAIKPVAPRDAC